MARKIPASDPSLLRARDAGYKKGSAFAEIYSARLKAGATENSGCQQNSHSMPIPLDERRKPASVKVHVSSGSGVDITWSDGHASHYDFAYLREECPCAMCNDERGKKEEKRINDERLKKENPHGAPPLMSSPALPMFKPKLRAQAAHAVGNYALQIDFNDGHTTGIYSFDYLRTICPCEDCAREFRSPSDLSSR